MGTPASAVLLPWAAIVDALADGVMVTDDDLEHGVRIVYVNAALCEITGYAAEELVGRSPAVLQGAATPQALKDRLRDDLLNGRPFSGQAINVRKDGTEFVMEWTISHVPGVDGAPGFFVAVQRDATLPTRRLLEAEERARRDPLTGLPNRRHLDDVLDGTGWLTTRLRTAIVLDVDRFKALNDRHGHLVGDEVLREVARRLTAVCRAGDVVARWGGEEFCVLTLADTHVEGLARRLHDAVGGEPIATSAGPLQVTASVGCATVDRRRRTASDLLRAADEAMYAAKRAGRDRVCVA